MTDLLHAAPSGIFSFNDEGGIVQVNDTLCRLLHLEAEELRGQKLEAIFPVATQIFYQTHFFPLLRMKGFVDEVFVSLKDGRGGEVPMLLSARRLEEGGGFENVCACLPVHHRRKYEDEILAAKRQAQAVLQENTAIREAKEQLQHHVQELDEQLFLVQQGNDELRQFNHIITHDLQEPIRKLLMFTDILQTGQPANPEKILGNINRVSRHIRNMLLAVQEYVQLDTDVLRLTDIDLNAVVLIARQRLDADYPGVNYQLHTEALPHIEGNFGQLVVLFYQLLSNSVKFRAPERPLRISIRGTITEYNRFRALQDRYKYTEHVKIDYADNGIGFEPRHHQRIFKLFQKLEPGTEGLGIGLTICKKIVVNHKGVITATAQKDRGAAFTIFLPLKAAPGPPVPLTHGLHDA